MTVTEHRDRDPYDRAMDALDLVDLLLERVDEQARRVLKRDDRSTDPWGDQP